ncbi:PDZ domain-containing protein [bacterium]|nr:PDZ domain-containing protein [bacterium]
MSWSIASVVALVCLSADNPSEVLVDRLREISVEGLLVFDVVVGSQAERADIHVGDIITHYDGQPVTRHQDLTQLARTASIDKKGEVLIIIRRGEEELVKNLPSGPMGVRLEDVSPAEKRSIRAAAPTAPDSIGDHYMGSLADQRTHFWYLISDRSGESPDQPPRPIGWAHHFFSRDNQQAAVLRIQQQVAFQEKTYRQDVVIGVDPDAPPEPTGLRVMIDDKLVLFARRQKGEWQGERMGVPVTSRSPAGTLSSYLLPYLAASMSQRKIDQCDGVYLPPASLEAAPLCQVDRIKVSGSPQGGYRVCVLGRTEMGIVLDRDGNVGRVELRGGTVLSRSSARDISAAYPDVEKAFSNIEQLQLTPPAEPVRAN